MAPNKTPGVACDAASTNRDTLAPIVHRKCMITDSALVYVGAAAQLAGINRFYTRRVMQRLNRGEITAQVAAELLIAAAKRGDRRLAPPRSGPRIPAELTQ